MTWDLDIGSVSGEEFYVTSTYEMGKAMKSSLVHTSQVDEELDLATGLYRINIPTHEQGTLAYSFIFCVLSEQIWDPVAVLKCIRILICITQCNTGIQRSRRTLFKSGIWSGKNEEKQQNARVY